MRTKTNTVGGGMRSGNSRCFGKMNAQFVFCDYGRYVGGDSGGSRKSAMRLDVKKQIIHHLIKEQTVYLA